MPSEVYSIFKKPSKASKPADLTTEDVETSTKVRKARKAATNGSTAPPIVLDDPPKKRPAAPVASTSKTTHPMFTAATTKGKATAQSPIIVPDSPVRVEWTFAERERKRKERFFGYKGYEARWPTAEDIHVRGEEEERMPVQVGGPSFDRKGKKRDDAPVEEPTFSFAQLNKREEEDQRPTLRPAMTQLTTSDVEKLLPDNHISHPLLARLAALALHRSTEPHCELWSHKYAPSSTIEVLGDISSASALTLRAWLLELAIKDQRAAKSPRKRQIVRQVKPRKRKKKVGEFDDFLAGSDDDEDQEPIIDFLDEEQWGNLPSSPLPVNGSAPSTPLRDDKLSDYKELTNLILLKGPTGSGKTACVYAAARELGFEVFELSPGGRRSGKDLETAVSGVSTGHLVSKGKEAALGGASPRRTSFFEPKGKKRAVIIDSDDVEEDVPLPAAKKPVEIKQSLILLEEVDVMFPDDKGFWEALIQLVSKSRRPIVMTCNDNARLPLAQLPVQDTLAFEPPSSDLATSYLHLIALSEGHILPPELIKELYSTIAASDPAHPPSAIGNTPLPPTPRSRLTDMNDLRHAVLQLQMLCHADKKPEDWLHWQQASSVPMDQVGQVDEEKRKDDAAGFTEARSFNDALVDRRHSMKIEDLDNYVGAEADIETAYPVLQLPFDPFRYAVLPDHARDLSITSALASLAARAYSTVTTELISEDIPDTTFARERRQFSQATERATTLLPLIAPLLPRSPITTDYLPYLRDIVAADDLHDAAFDPDDPSSGSGVSSGKRRTKTRASSKRFERHLDLSNQALDAIRGMGFPSD